MAGDVRYDADEAPGRLRPSGQGRIEEHLSTLDDALSLVAEAVERAGLRLSPVLRPDEETDTRTAEGRAVAMIRTQSALADRLEAAAARAHTLGRALRDTLDRVDL